MNIESARLAELMPAIGGLIQPVAAIQKWQAELSATPLWLLQTLLGVVFDSRMRGVPHRPQPFRPRVLAGIEAVHGQARRTADVGGIAADDCPAADRNPTVCAQYVFEQQRVQRDAGQAGDVFWKAVLINAALMMIRSVNLIINDFLDQALAIKWSEQLNRVLTENWLARKNYYRLQMRRDAPDNIDQRIQMDAQDFIVSTITFLRGMLNSIVSTIEFTIVLWGLAGILPVFGFEVPHGIVFLVYIAILAAPRWPCG